MSTTNNSIASEDEDDRNKDWFSERSSISGMAARGVESEWSFRSSTTDIGNGRFRRASFLANNANESQMPTNINTNNNVINASNLAGSFQLNSKQMDLLKDFLFDSWSLESPPSGRGFGKTKSFKRLLSNTSSKDVDLGSIFETTFDLTEDRLKRLFDSFDGNSNGTITYEELKLGFTYHGADLGMSELDDKTFLALVAYLDADKSGEITFEEFSEGIRLLLLRTILKKVSRSETVMDSVITQVFDYNIGKYDRYLLYGKGQVKQTKAPFVVHSKPFGDFFLHERGDEVAVRWINITGEKASNIMKMMALKYRLHPLALEDALEWTDHRPKADSYDGHYFIMVPVFYLKGGEGDGVNGNSEVDPTDKKQTQPQTWWERTFFRTQRTSISRTSESAPTDDDDDDDEASVDDDDGGEHNLIGVHMTSIFITKPEGKTVITFNNEHNDNRCWDKLQDELKKDYSKLRQYDGQYLAYRLLDEAVDKIGEIVKKLKTLIKKEKKLIVRENYKNLDRIHSYKEQMYSMSRKFKPFLRLLVHVIEDDSFSPGASIYLRDVLDNLEIHDDDVKVLIAMCDAVDAEDEKRQAKQMDSTLYTLTVFTVTILPAQFFTGVWGMNFANMPELKWQYGYLIFWLVAIGTSVITVSLLNFSRHSRNY